MINLAKQPQKSQRLLLIDSSNTTQESRPNSRMKDTTSRINGRSKEKKTVGMSKERLVGRSKERKDQVRSREKDLTARGGRREDKKTKLPTCSYRIKLT